MNGVTLPVFLTCHSHENLKSVFQLSERNSLSSVLDVSKIVWLLDNRVTLEYTDVCLSFLWPNFLNKIFSSPEIHRFVDETFSFLSADGRRLVYFSLSLVIRDPPVLLTPLVHLTPYPSVVGLWAACFNIKNLFILPEEWTSLFGVIRRINSNYLCKQH